MKIKAQIFAWLLISSSVAAAAACGAGVTVGNNQNADKNAVKTNAGENSNAGKSESTLAEKTPARTDLESQQSKQPKTVREFFNLLPQKYFPLEGCADNPTEKNCDRARREYLKNYLEVEDAQNGYLKAGCDGAQSCIQMALFKRAEADYLVGLEVSHETSENYFLEYKNGEWREAGAAVVPEFSKNNFYEIPRYGTTVKVFERRKISEAGESEKGANLYDLVWKNGKFTVQK